MNKRKKVAIIKHRSKKKKLEEKRKALSLALGGTSKQAVKVAPKKDVLKPVNAFSNLLKTREEAPAKKTPVKKEKEELVKTAAAPDKDEKAKKTVAKKKKTETAESAAVDTKAETAKKPAVKKKKTSEEAG